MHKVKCYYCGLEFDRDKEPARQISARRYAHEECAKIYSQEKTQEEKDLEALEKYIMKLFNQPYINALVRKQIRDYRKEYNYTYSGILKTLIYWFEIKGNSIDSSYEGIGIVPYIYNSALKYYCNLFLIKEINKNKNINEYKPKVKIIKIFSPKIRPKQKKLFNFDDGE